MSQKLKVLTVFIMLIILPLVGCGDKPEHNANWYYYWEKDNVVPDLDRTGSPASRWDWSVEAANQGVFGASHGPSDGYVLTDLCITNPIRSPFLVIHKTRLLTFNIGSTTTFGVERVAGTTSHEKQHITNYKFIQLGNADTDLDGLADSLENIAPYYFIIGDRDSYNIAGTIHPHYSTYGDNEFTARQAEQAGVNAADKNADWSMGGAQWRH